ncbi:MAG: DUF924 domain-containing protein [Deltaproteobacteria bacterium]|nr:DUF924 domain-containing protein [Deltaproteobacteria bacterium]
MNALATDLLAAWFGTDDTALAAVAPRWWRRDPAFDASLRERFEPSIGLAAAGAFLDWETTAEGALALVILLDQIPRNVYRDSPRAFAQDAAAICVARRALARGFDRALIVVPKRSFLLMPLLHAEDPEVQAESLARQEALAVLARGGEWEGLAATGLDFALQHAAIVRRFGRYPHRNEVLGRASTAEERAFLTQPGSRF